MPRLRDVADTLGSAYLLEHVSNPVEWRTWGEDALELARERDVPVFLSVGYAACHWCHVMAHESFEDPAVAQVLNENFVPIKVDREERPDVDALYMAATQLVSGHGGWPMSVFLLPDGRPFMAGTYYPPLDRGGQIGFTHLLEALCDAWLHQRGAVEAQAEELTRALERDVRFIDHLAPSVDALDLTAVRTQLARELVARVDSYGGFGDAPKFPRPSYLDILLDVDDPESRAAAAATLRAMSHQGLYDHLGGGFARYSVDATWRVPHFEKMLSDQALLARTYFRAARAWREPLWRDVALATVNFVVRDLLIPGGFASSLDADTPAGEGRHVTWTREEVLEVLDRSGHLNQRDEILARWRLGAGEFEGRDVPRLGDDQPFLVPDHLRAGYEALLAARRDRPQPRRDEKIVLEWNAMTVSALLTSDDDQYVTLGLGVLEDLHTSHFCDDVWWRTQFRSAHATAADVAWLGDAHLDAFELTGRDEHLTRANELARYLLAHYWDGAVPTPDAPQRGGGLFSQSDLVTDLRLRVKDVMDGATPSSHATATRFLARLGLMGGDPSWLCVAQRLVDLAAALLAHHPAAVPDLVAAAGFALEGVEVVVPGESNELTRHLRSLSMSRSVLVTGSGSSPLLVGRDNGRAYVCRAGVCQRPVDTVAALDAELARVSD